MKRLVLILSTFVLILGTFVPNLGQSAPTHEASGGGVRVVVYNDKCALLQEVTNLPLRAVWTEKGKNTEGCFGISQGVLVFYFSDKTVFAMPMAIFVRVTGT